MFQLPEDHQSLFIWAIDARKSVIHEFSGNIRRECLALRQWARRYARQHNLVAPQDDENYGLYYVDEDDEIDYPELLVD